MNFKIGDIVKGSTLGYESKVGKIVKIDEDDQEFMYAIICDVHWGQLVILAVIHSTKRRIIPWVKVEP